MSQGAEPNPGFSFAGYHRFWCVADFLLRDLDPPDSAWRSLFAAPGYRELARRDRFAEGFMETVRMALMPSRGHLLAHVLQGGADAGILRHVLAVAATRSALGRAMRAVEETPLAASARAAALAWLPQGPLPDFPDVSFVIFAPDALGQDGVVLDARHFCASENPALLLAHAYHHVFRRRLAARPGAVPPGGEDVLWVLDQLELEGIADQIDKRAWPAALPPGPDYLAEYGRRYRAAFQAAPGQLRRLDALLEAWLRLPRQRPRLARRMRLGLPLAGHPTGSFMARSIERAYGRAACISAVGDPFAFLRLYSASAAGDAPPLSAAALAAIDQLEGASLPRA